MATPDVWSRLPQARRPTLDAAKAARDSNEAPRRTLPWLPRGRWLDIVAFVFWIYLGVKAFAVDIDRIALRAIDPRLEPLADYRLVVYLGIIALAVWLGRRHWLRVLYILLFPIVVVCWKLPYFFYRRRSWPLMLATLQSIASVSADLRYRVAVTATWLIATVFVVFTSIEPAQVVAAVFFAWFVAWSFVRFVKHTLRRPSFAAIQQQWIRRLLARDHLAALWGLEDEYRDPSIVLYTEGQTQQVAMRISFGILLNRALKAWATQLQRYQRDYAPALVFGTISFLSLFVGTVVSLGLLNLAIYRVEPAQYSVATEPTALSFILYGLASLTASGAAGIQAVGQLALVVLLLSGISGVVVLVSVILNFAMTLRRERDDAATRELVVEINDSATRQEERFIQEYEVGVDEAQRRLDEVGGGYGVLVTLFKPKGDSG